MDGNGLVFVQITGSVAVMSLAPITFLLPLLCLTGGIRMSASDCGTIPMSTKQLGLFSSFLSDSLDSVCLRQLIIDGSNGCIPVSLSASWMSRADKIFNE